MASEEGVIAAVHAGWRGVAAGVLQSAAEAMRARGASAIDAVVSACIHPECYEFSPEDLDALCRQLGEEVRTTTAAGRPAFDLPGAVRAGLAQADITVRVDLDSCTACEGEWFSARGRSDVARQALAIWRQASG